MKKSINTKISSLLVLLSVTFTVLTTASFAWFATFTEVLHEDHFAGSSIASYFYEGEGTEEYPYVINDARHLYNLAWLQQTGVFTAETHFAICNNWKEKQPIILDMGGKISGADEKNYGGAIPPIGTDKAPFIGHFNGYGSTISNLWVSTKMEDWKEQPHGDNGYASTHVGLFGAVSGDAIIENFVLDTIEVKTTFDATVGIICGLVDANVQNVGVYNAILNISDGATASSKYSLIGDKTDRVIWEDLPQIDPELDGEGNVDTGGDDAGGTIKVDVNDTNNPIVIPSGTNGYVKVPNSAKNRAFVLGPDLDILGGNSSPQVNSMVYLYKDLINSTDSAGIDIGGGGSGDFVGFTKENYTQAFLDANTNPIKDDEGNVVKKIVLNAYFTDRIPTSDNAKVSAIDVTVAPNYSQEKDADGNYLYLTEVTLPRDTDGDGEDDDFSEKILIPKNTVWFKPLNSGQCLISFMVNDLGGGERYRSIYRFKRDADGNIDGSTWTETRLVFKKQAPFNNKELAVFFYEVSESDIQGEYEFLIGAPTLKQGEDKKSDEGIYFYFLALAGAGNTGGGSNTPGGGDDDEQEPPKMYDLDYVISPTTKVAAEGYENHKTVLRVTDAKDTRIYYLAAQTADDSDVFYYKTATATIADISIGQESAVGAWGVNLGTGTAKYKNRDDSDPQIYGPQPT